MSKATKTLKEKADKAYEAGKPIMSDAEYDKLFGANADAKVLVDKSPWKKVKHTLPMYSLNKVEVIDEDNKPYFSNLIKWKKKVKASDYIVTRKYDGAAIILYYEDGFLVNAVTRGDGAIGEDVTRNVIKAKNVKKQVPSSVKALIGEVIIERSTFEKYLKEEYSNPRNGATGALKDFEGRNAKYLTIKYHNLEFHENFRDADTNVCRDMVTKFKIMRSGIGLKGIWYKRVTQLKGIYKTEMKERKSLNYEIDGLVISANSLKLQKKLGRDTSGNPKYSCAVKFPYQRKSTKLVDIEWSVGNIGIITPIAVFEEIDLGVNVTRASLANLDKMKELWGERKPRIGDVIEVSRRGDVIPKVEAFLRAGKGKELNTAAKCPVCKSTVVIDGPRLLCSNADCEERHLGDLYKWAHKIKDHFKVKNLGPERIYQMYQGGLIKNASDLYKLKPGDIIGKIEGIKAKSAANLLAFQEYREIPLDLFLGGLNVPGIGQGVFTFLIEAGYDTLDKIVNMGHAELAAVDNMGDIRARMVLTWLKKKDKLIKELLKQVSIVKPDNSVDSNKLQDKSFCITGTLSQPRSYFEDMIKKNGGKVAGISKNLTYLLAGESAGSKLSKAQSLGIKIISEKQFLSLLD